MRFPHELRLLAHDLEVAAAHPAHPHSHAPGHKEGGTSGAKGVKGDDGGAVPSKPKFRWWGTK